jgi:hypothetical protein
MILLIDLFYYFVNLTYLIDIVFIVIINFIIIYDL